MSRPATTSAPGVCSSTLRWVCATSPSPAMRIWYRPPSPPAPPVRLFILKNPFCNQKRDIPNPPAIRDHGNLVVPPQYSHDHGNLSGVATENSPGSWNPGPRAALRICLAMPQRHYSHDHGDLPVVVTEISPGSWKTGRG